MQVSDTQDFILYDWVSITSNIHDVGQIIALLGMQDCNWVTTYGTKGFLHRMYYDCISIHFGRDDDYIWLEMSGQGCRAFETFGTGDFQSLFDLVIDNPGNCKLTRLDVAFDDKMGALDIGRLCSDTRLGNFVSRFSNYLITEGTDGTSVCHGSQKSDVYIRIYDKAAERGFDDGRHWVRCELQLRRDRALQFILAGGTLQERYFGVLSNYLRFVVPSDDINKRRWPTAQYWDEFLNNAVPLSIYVKPGVEYNYWNMTDYVFKQAGNAIDATLTIMGIDRFVNELKARGTAQNPKYLRLIEESERMKANATLDTH